jgi:hypothetical protein
LRIAIDFYSTYLLFGFGFGIWNLEFGVWSLKFGVWRTDAMISVLSLDWYFWTLHLDDDEFGEALSRLEKHWMYDVTTQEF